MLQLLSLFAREEAAHLVLEYLVRRFAVHEHHAKRSKGLGGQPQEGPRRDPVSAKASDSGKGTSGDLEGLSDQRHQSVERRRVEGGLPVLLTD